MQNPMNLEVTFESVRLFNTNSKWFCSAKGGRNLYRV